MSECKNNATNFPPDYDTYAQEEKDIVDRNNAEQQRIMDQKNAYALTNFNNAKRDFHLNHGRAPGQAPSGEKAPEQPAEVCYWMDYSGEEWVQRNGLTGNLLGEPYAYSSAGRAPGTIVFGPIINELSREPYFAVYKDSDSAVELGTVHQENVEGGNRKDGTRYRRWFRLEQVDGFKRWYQTAAPEE